MSPGGDYYGQATVPAGLNGVVAIAAGQFHSLALKSDGSVVAWRGGLTHNVSDSVDFGQAMIPNGLGNVIAIAAGYDRSLALVAHQAAAVAISPQSQIAILGDTVEFRADPGTLIDPRYTWSFNGSVIGNTSSGPQLELTNVQTSQSEAYTVNVSNSVASATSAAATFFVVPLVDCWYLPAITVSGTASSVLHLDYADALGSTMDWLPLAVVPMNKAVETYF